MRKLPFVFAVLGFGAIGLIQQPALADSLETMERERAVLLETILDPTLAPNERETKIVEAKRRLVDMERRVLRDDSLKGKNTPNVRSAFENYDLTFLASSSLEKNRTILDVWMEQVGISTHSLMNASIRRR